MSMFIAYGYFYSEKYLFAVFEPNWALIYLFPYKHRNSFNGIWWLYN